MAGLDHSKGGHDMRGLRIISTRVNGLGLCRGAFRAAIMATPARRDALEAFTKPAIAVVDDACPARFG